MQNNINQLKIKLIYLKNEYRIAKDDAEKAFEAVLQLRPADGPSALYLERIGQLRYAPPQENWDGVWTMTEK